MKRSVIVICGMLMVAQCVVGQIFNLMRYDDDYSGWSDSVGGFYNKLKYIQFAQNKHAYLSLGGEIRGELNYVLNEDWGEKNVGRDVFLLQRYHVHADFHLSNRVRVFGQLRSGLEDGRKNGPRGIDEDKLNVQNLFVDVVPYEKQDKTLMLRVGRQEIRYGSGRLIDVRDGPNLRLYFDGVKFVYASHHLHIDAFVMADARVNAGFFDNSSTRKANLWGVYNTCIIPGNLNFDFYYLGINRENVLFDEVVANESRHTFGTRFWKNGIGFIYNFEAAYQGGVFDDANIAAIAVSSEIGYKFEHTTRLPVVKLKTDYISGDKEKSDGKIQTFNAMYPNGGYFGMNPQAGPANLISIHPSLTWNPKSCIVLTMDAVFYWRNSLNDGVYGPNGVLRLSSFDSKERYIGTAYMTTFSWSMNDFINCNIGVQYFKAGSFIHDVIAQYKDGFFVGTGLGIKF